MIFGHHISILNNTEIGYLDLRAERSQSSVRVWMVVNCALLSEGVWS